MLHKFKLGFRRNWRARTKQVSAAAEQSGDSFERYFIQRLGKFGKVWRFVTGWTVLFVLLIGCLVAQNQALNSYYQTRQPIRGGVYTEGILGQFTNANPIYATNNVDKTVSRLVFSGLFKYDHQNRLVGDLAQSWSVDGTGKIYTVKLRDNLRWHDGQPLTAADVVFTYQVIQNPDAESPLRNDWAGITVAATDNRTVTFTLPNPLSSFIYGATNGIVPKHILGGVPMAGLRSTRFNTQSPVGTGPFAWRDIDITGSSSENAQESVGLTAFDDYWAGPPRLKAFVVHAFAQRDDMIAAYKKDELTAMSGLDTVPADVSADDMTITSFPLTAETMVFFRTTALPFEDRAVRQALVLASDPEAIMARLPYPARPVREPLLTGQLGFDPRYVQETDQIQQAARLLDKAGWKLGGDGLRHHGDKALRFTLAIANTSEYKQVASQLQQQWRAVGADVTVSAQDSDTFRENLGGHQYDAVLYGIAVGSDPDIFVYWQSSQGDIRSINRLNLSEYKSTVADDALEAGRTRTEPALRVIKYQAFLKQWQKDAPALALYQPRYLYISHKKVYNLNEHVINEATDRLYSAHDWMIRTARVTNR
jgi:peptide/nickel transport system substrate-binding protein